MFSDVEQADDSYGAATWRAYALMLAERLRAAELELVDLRSGAPTRTTTPRTARRSDLSEIDLRDGPTDGDGPPDLDAERFGPGPDADFWSESGRDSVPKPRLRSRFGRSAKGSADSVPSDGSPTP